MGLLVDFLLEETAGFIIQIGIKLILLLILAIVNHKQAQGFDCLIIEIQVFMGSNLIKKKTTFLTLEPLNHDHQDQAM